MYQKIIKELEKADPKEPPHPLQPVPVTAQKSLIEELFRKIKDLSQHVLTEKKIHEALKKDRDKLRTQLKRYEPDNQKTGGSTSKRARHTPNPKELKTS